MSRRNFRIPEHPEYDPEIPELLNEDLASATGTFNPLFQRLIDNTHAHENRLNETKKFVLNFAVSEWVQSGTIFKITISSNSNNIGANPIIQVQRLQNGSFVATHGTPSQGHGVSILPNGDIELAASTPFDGRIIVIWGEINVLHNRAVNPETDSLLPRISQIRILGSRLPNRQPDMGVTLIFDRPAPAGCYIQFHRFSKKSGRRNAESGRRIRKAFRAIDVFSENNPQWHLPIPEGATQITTAPIREIYIPPRVRSPGRPVAVHPNNAALRMGWDGRNNKFSESFANKCTYKFSIIIPRNEESGIEKTVRGELSAETLEIMRYGWGWFFWNKPPDIIARIY